MLWDFDINQILVMGAIALVGHALWLALSMKLNPAFLMAAVFLLVSPFSIAGTWTAGPYKLARIYSTILIVVSGLFMTRQTGLGPASKAFLLFVFVYVLAAVYSGEAIKGLMYKGLFGMLALAGVLLGNTLHSFRELRTALRILIPAAVWWAIVIWMDINSYTGKIGRLQSYGINANAVATTSAFYAIICGYLALYDNSKFWKTTAYVVGVAVALIIPFTGSRGGLGTAVLACTFIGLPLVKNPGRLLFIVALIAATAYASEWLTGRADAAERLTSLEFTREGPWTIAMNYFRASPIFGHGWVYHYLVRGEATTENLHSIYMNILAEIGLIGITLMFACFAVIFSKAMHAYNLSRAIGYTPAIYFALGILVANLGDGAFEIGPLVGTTVNGLFFGLSVGLIDRVPGMVYRHHAEMNAAYAQPELDYYTPADEDLVIPPSYGWSPSRQF